MLNFFKRRVKLSSKFQSRHSETCIENGNQKLLNVAHDLDRGVVTIWYHQAHFEIYPKDALLMLNDLCEQIEAVIQTITAEVSK